MAVASGGLVALMILLNGGLQGRIGALPALIVIHFMGLVGSGVFLALSGRRAGGQPKGPEAGKLAPHWFVVAGIFGIGVVFLNNLVFGKGGVLLALGGTLAGQTLVAHLLEGTRWFDGRKSPVAQRILSLALVLPGAAIIGLRSGVGIVWVLVSWVPGGILMFQSMMNTRNALRWGQPKMLLLNYASALSVLVPLYLIVGSSAGRGFPHLFQAAASVPPYVSLPGGVIGVIVIGTTAFLLNRSSAIKVVLALYVGQIGIGILLDALSGLSLQPEKVIGVAMVLLGLGAGELHRLRALGRGRTKPTGGAAK